MAYFTSTQAAEAAGLNPKLATLAVFEFAEETVRLWDGAGDIVIGGDTYRSVGQFGSVQGVSFSEDDSADRVEFALSGVDPTIVALAKDSAAVRGREVRLYGQFFDPASNEALDDKFLLRWLIMDALSYQASGPVLRNIILTAETIWTARNVAAYAYYSDKDQQARFAGDRGCEYIAGLKHKVVTWPRFA